MSDSAEKPRIGVVGTGYWAEPVHAAGAAAHPGVDLVGVWGRDPAKAAALAGPHQARAYDDFDDLLDAVDLLTHENGATSLMSLCMTMPAEIERAGAEFYDEHGWHVRPDLERDVDQAYANALSDLLANIAAGENRHRCDVRFGRDVVAVLARCEQALG